MTPLASKKRQPERSYLKTPRTRIPTPATRAAPSASIDNRSILAVVIGAIKDLWSKVLALIESDEAQNARIKQLEDEVSALKAAAGARPTGEASGAPTGDASAVGDEAADDGTGTTAASAASSTTATLSPPSTDQEAADAPTSEEAGAPDEPPALEITDAGASPTDAATGGSAAQTNPTLLEAANDNAPPEQLAADPLPATDTE
jgi:hypothetical protein